MGIIFRFSNHGLNCTTSKSSAPAQDLWSLTRSVIYGCNSNKNPTAVGSFFFKAAPSVPTAAAASEDVNTAAGPVGAEGVVGAAAPPVVSEDDDIPTQSTSAAGALLQAGGLAVSTASKLQALLRLLQGGHTISCSSIQTTTNSHVGLNNLNIHHDLLSSKK
eukprot:jgi/Psemu1/51087/gm1.51087_g